MSHLKNLKAYVNWPFDRVESTDILFAVDDKLNMPLIDVLMLYLNENYDKDIDPMYGYDASDFKWSRCSPFPEDDMDRYIKLECDISGTYHGYDIDCHVNTDVYLSSLMGDTIEDVIKHIVRIMRCEYECQAYEEMKRIEKATAWQDE